MASIISLSIFNGTDDYIDTGHTYEKVFQDSFSISVWVKPYNGRPENEMQIFLGNKGPDRKNGCNIQLKCTGRVQFVYEANGVSIPTRTKKPVFFDGMNEWTHIVAVADNSTKTTKLYINGELDRLERCPDMIFENYNCPYNVLVGCRNTAGTPTHFFEGEISDMQIVDRAFSGKKIQKLFMEGRYE